MSDKLTRMFATSTVVIAVLALVRTLPGPQAAQAQAPTIQLPPPPVMAVDRGMVYILQDGKMSMYSVDEKSNLAFIPKPLKLKLLATQDLRAGIGK
jgi:hypothetical protein